MPDNIERTIYRLEVDESGYIRGVDSAAASTQKLIIAQNEANDKLRQSRENLRLTSADLVKAKTDLDNYTGSNEKARAQRIKLIDDLKKQEALFTEEVKKNQKAYEDATVAAQKFASAAQGGATPSPIPTPATGPVSGGILPAGSAGATLQSLIEKVDTSNFTDISDVLELAADDFELFRQATIAAGEELEVFKNTEGATAEEIELMSQTLDEAKAIIQEYDELTKTATVSTVSYRTQISNLTKELQVLDQEGKSGTEEFKQKEIQLIRVTKAYKDQREVIRVLASDTRALDFGKAALQTAITGFQTYASVAILAGNASEDLQKKTFQLFAAMQLLTSLQDLHNKLKATGVLRLGALSAAQATYTAVVGTTTGALKAFRIALLTTGIGVIVAGIGFLIAKLIQYREETAEAAKQQKLLNEVNEEAAKSVAASVTKIIIYREKLNDLTLSEKERINIAKEYNKIADEQNKIDLKQINNLGSINQLMQNQIILLEQRALAAAASAKLTEQANRVIEAELKIGTIAADTGFTADNLITQFQALREETAAGIKELSLEPTLGDVFLDAVTGGPAGQTAIISKVDKYNKDLAKAMAATGKISIDERQILQLIKLIPERNKAVKDLDEMALRLKNFFTVSGLTEPPPPGKTIDNVFDEEMRRLLDRLRQLRIDEEVGIRKINDQFVFNFEKEQIRIGKLLKDKKITLGQAADLLEISASINKVELDKALADFNKSVLESREKLNEELKALEQKNAEDQLNLIQDEFDRRAALIEFNEKRELDIAKKANDERLKQLESVSLSIAPSSIPEADPQREAIRQQELESFRFFQSEKNRITQEGEEEQTNITLRAARQRSELANEIFLRSLDAFDQAISDTKLINDKAQLEEIRKLVDSFSIGAISYEDYRKKLSAIQDKYDRLQLVKQVETIQEELRVLRRRLNNTLDTTSKHYDDLIKLIKQKELELVAAQKNLETSGVGGDDGTTKKVETINEYAQAIGDLMNNIVRFWAETNAAEAAALDRSIALQERRVNEAQKLAERGNATYLRMEEDRLKELQIAKENAARKQLAIDAALQASQLLVGVTGAIADLAKGPGGIARTIADIAVIVGALAAGYALVRSLQNNQPKFATGTKSVKRTKEPAGTDTIPAMLTEGEAIITRDKNKAYHPVIEAIHDGTVPAQFLNKQVEHYHNREVVNRHTEKYHTLKTAPQVNYQRIKDTATMYISNDGKLAAIMHEQNKKIDENNDLQRQTLRAMKNMSVSANIDKDGIAIAVNEYVEKMKIDKRV